MKNKIKGDEETTRSGLFFEAIRIIGEMRENNPGKPRYAIYENVMGAFSSNNGEDFRLVLESFCRISDPNFDIPMPYDGWKPAGVIDGENFQLAWRVFDAQFWGVPQRRKRIYMLFDADGHTAKDILFSNDDNFRIDWRENSNSIFHAYGLTAKGNGDAFISDERHCSLTTGGGKPGQGYPACLAMDGHNGKIDEVQATLGQNCGMSSGRNGVLETENICLNDQGGQRMDVSVEKTGTLRAGATAGVLEKRIYGFCPQAGGEASGSLGMQEEVSPTLNVSQMIDILEVRKYAIPLEHHPQVSRIKVKNESDAMQTLTSNMGKGGGNVPLIMVPIDADRIVGTLEACDGPSGFHSQSVGEGKYVIEKYVDPKVIACIEGDGQRPSHNGPGYNSGDISYTLNTVEKPIVVYGISSYSSSGMLSENPKSGIYEADTSKTLDCNGGNPACNQGGMVIVEKQETFDVRVTSEGTKNARAHAYETDTARCLDTHAPSPEGNHGGIAVCEPVYVMTKNSHMTNVMEEKMDTLVASQYKGPTVVVCPNDEVLCMATQQGGAEIMKDKCPTITASAGMSGNNQPVISVPDDGCIAFSQNQREEVRDLQGVAGALAAEPGTHQQTLVATTYEKKNFAGEYRETDESATLKASGGNLGGGSEVLVKEMIEENNANAKHQQTFIKQQKENDYTVRRLTPKECAKLQGFPTWWCKGLGTDEISDEEIDYWRNVWIEWNRISGGKAKPKSDSQIIKWLKDPYSDAAEYKLWGNGICLQNALFIMRGIERMASSNKNRCAIPRL